MSLSMMESKLPPGFRFHPRDDELICDYLSPKIASKNAGHLATEADDNQNIKAATAAAADGYPFLIDVDLNKCEPWDLPAMACVGAKEWYFFNLRDRKYATGQRTNRATMSGYWKATGKDRQVIRMGVLVGMRKTLVFYQGRAPKGKKTDWVMHEFRLEGRASTDPPPNFSYKEDWVLCRVFYKSRAEAVGVASKPSSSESCYDDDTGSSSVPPPLTDGFLSFDPTGSSSNNNNNNFTTAPASSFEQVPCFSNNYHHQLTAPQQYKSFSQGLMASSCFSNPLSIPPPACDQKIMRTYLDHLNSHPQQQQQRSYLPGNGVNSSSSVWYPFHN